ncbi:MAG: MFS transporter [Oscillospiraceae bacterium]
MSQPTNAAPKSTKPSLLTKDFILVVIGQIISLFGNAALRFALPLYILDQTGSEALFGIVSALSFLPMVILSPIGGIIADRVNKQRIMVILDFFTAALVMSFLLLNGIVAITPLVVIVLMLLYGIQGAYTPSVQASLPILAPGESLVTANAVVNMVSSLSGLLGPVIGGILYSTYGLVPILVVSSACFAFSAIMELFIKIPHSPQPKTGNMFSIVKSDMSVSLRYIFREQPVFAKVIGLIFFFNLFLSSMLIIGTPLSSPARWV